MYEETLKHAGLSKDQASIYEILVKNGALTAGELSTKSPLKRGLVYMILGQLETMGLVSKSSTKKITSFEPAHPIRLKELAEQKEIEARNAQIAVSGILNQLSSDFNLSSGKPGVLFYEGIEGAKKVLADSLESRTEIYSYVDIEAVSKFIGDINKKYVSKREALKIKKKGIVLDSPFAREYLKNYHPNVTETKLIKYAANPFQAIMQIYDGKVSYITLGEKIIGVVIDNDQIYKMHKYIFEYTWENAVPITEV